MLRRDANLKWCYDQDGTKIVQGSIMSVISSKKPSSLVLLRHKENPENVTSSLSVFYFSDNTEEMDRWRVLENLQDHQRVIQINL